MNASDLARLSDPFDPADIEWKPGATTRDKTKGLAMAYLTSRAVQQRFDDVCGPGDWRNEFREGPSGGVLCGLSIRVERPDGTSEWVTKWDGSDNSQVEAVKGGLSGSMKRAAVQWGVGRYLYDLPATWVRLDDRGRFAEAPRIPPAFLPKRSATGGGRSAATPPRPEPSRPETSRPEASRPEARPSPPAGEDPARRPSASRPAPRSSPRQVNRPGASGDGANRRPEPGF